MLRIATNWTAGFCTQGSNSDCLPSCAKTLLKTPRTIQIRNLGNGKYYYFGVSDRIKKCIEEGLTRFQFPIMQKLNIDNLITISISTDGIPIFKSSNTQMWPILFKVDQAINPKPYVAGLYCGETKPSVLGEFFSDFVCEFLKLESEGLVVNNLPYVIRISCIIADAPARSFIKAIKCHTAYHGCERCIDDGEWEGRIVYSDAASTPRNDISFKTQEDRDHHVGISPLVDLKLGMVSQVVLDYMHLTCLGVTRKLIFLWLNGPLSVKLSAKQVKELSEHLEKCKSAVPSEFSRKPRSLKEIHRYKATEFRSFLLYTGPVILRGILKDNIYRNFILLSCAFKIFLSSKVASLKWLMYGRKLLEKFVSGMKEIYGTKSIVYNVHNLLHVSEDATNFGNLDSISAFPFETYLGSLKRLVRGHNLPMEQVVKRLLEKENFEERTIATQSTSALSISKNYISVGSFNLKVYNGKSFVISKRCRDSVFVTTSGKVLLLRDLLVLNNETHLVCSEFVEKSRLNGYPCDSAIFGVHRLLGTQGGRITVDLKSVQAKCIVLPCKTPNKYVCLAM